MKHRHFNLLLFFAIAAFTLTSCFGGVTYSIDNPTDQAIEVSIDGRDAITIAPMELKRMDGTLKEGEHTMTLKDGEEIKFILDKDQVMLNPTLSTYVTALEEYSVGGGMQSSKNDTILVIDGKEYEGPFPAVSNYPFIYSGNLNYHVDKPFKAEITTSKSGTVTMRKLFRKDEFIKYYKEEYM